MVFRLWQIANAPLFRAKDANPAGDHIKTLYNRQWAWRAGLYCRALPLGSGDPPEAEEAVGRVRLENHPTSNLVRQLRRELPLARPPLRGAET